MALYKELATNNAWLLTCGNMNNRELAEYFNTSERTIRRARKLINDQFSSLAKSVRDKDDVTVVVEATELPVEKRYTVIASDNSITITLENETETITCGDPKFEQVSEIVWNGRGSQESLAEAFDMISRKQNFVKLTKGLVEVDSEFGVVRYGGYEIDDALEDRIIRACEEGDNTSLEGLVEFTIKLYENPSRTSVLSLYRFLEAADIKIREDGMVECFKKVRDNYTDCHSGTFDNSIGAKPSVPRWEVDEDIHRTCSKGLHVCSAGYLPHFGGERVVKVLVHPKDFVAVPHDYNNAKARVCAYEVISEVTEW